MDKYSKRRFHSPFKVYLQKFTKLPQMELICYPLLGTSTRKRLQRTRGGWGKMYHYTPQHRMLVRLSKQLNLSVEAIRIQLHEERKFLISQKPQI